MILVILSEDGERNQSVRKLVKKSCRNYFGHFSPGVKGVASMAKQSYNYPVFAYVDVTSENQHFFSGTRIRILYSKSKWILHRIIVVRFDLRPTVKGNNPSSSFFLTLWMIFIIKFYILFSETLLIYQTNSWVSQNNIKYKSEFGWTVLNGMAPANYIQAAASWLATAAQPTK